MILLDTHAALWLRAGDAKLGAMARAEIERAWQAKEVAVSAISFWEMAMLREKGRIGYPDDVSRWRVEQLGQGLIEIPVDVRSDEKVLGLSESQIARRVKAVAKAAGLADWEFFSGHSGRVGMARRMAQNGALTSAFSCELAMKAICLTCNDMAIKTHDLLDLFEDLPDECKGRIVADYPEISGVLEQSRQTFEKWRYFEVAVAEEALGTMINTDRSAKLAKAARVILDEAAAVGLQGVVNVNATRNGQVQGDRTLITDHLKVSVKGGECPPHVLEAWGSVVLQN